MSFKKVMVTLLINEYQYTGNTLGVAQNHLPCIKMRYHLAAAHVRSVALSEFVNN